MADTALRWQQRRGMKELDLLFERWYRKHYEAATAEQRATYARLLQREDPEIWLWVLGQEPPPPEFAHVIAALRRHD
jgi:antitoxin CptB